jgi:hypothetical protein
LNDASADADCERLGTTELLHDVLDVGFDRLFGDEQLLGDIPVTVTARDLTKDFDFPVLISATSLSRF